MSDRRLTSLVFRALLWTGAILALVVVLAFLGGVFHERIEPSDPGPPVELPLPFDRATETTAIAVDEVTVERFPGTVQAIREAILSSRILSTVRDVRVRPGSRVQEGEEVILLDARELDARERQAAEGLTASESRLREASSTFERMQKLVESGAVSRQTFEQAESAWLVARADVESARKRLEEARVNRTYATIRAPFDAVVIDRLVEPGDTASPNTPLLDLYDPTRMRLETYVRESMAVDLEPGQSVRVQLETIDLEIAGTVEEIVPQAEAGSRSFLVKVALPATDRLYPGMFGRLLLQSRSRRRILVPIDSVLAIGQLRYVVLADARRTRRLVVPGFPRPDGTVELLSGLTEGETILVPRAEDG